MKKKKTKKNGFTLIELLAVIIILGILMIIAIPSVTSYINNSRKSAYVDTAKQLISGARNMVNEGKLPMYATDTTYYIPASCIATENGGENGAKSPYGEFAEAYVVVNFDGNNFSYSWVSRDVTGQGVKTPISVNELKEGDIESDIEAGDIQVVPSSGKTNVVELNSSCKSFGKICRRATIAHTATCTATDTTGYCSGAGYREGGSKGTTTITYGTIKSKGSALAAGDALDCDVNEDGNYDPATERFYYVTSSGSGAEEKAVLIYYTNVTGGTTPTKTDTYAYDTAGQTWHGPRTAYPQLPSTSQWSNSQIIKPVANRQITSQGGLPKVSNGNLAIDPFTYEGKAARLLTYQELVAACGSSTVNSQGYLDSCNYFNENIKYYETGSGTWGFWLETPYAANNISVYTTVAYYRTLIAFDSYGTSSGVRPVIEVLKSNIEN